MSIPPLRTKLEQLLAWVVLALLLFGCLLVLLPFVSALLWGTVLCVSSWPLYRRLLNAVRGRRTLAASLMALGMICVILLPFVVVGASLSENVQELTTATRRWIDAGPPPPPAWLGKIPGVGQQATEYWQSLAADSSKLIAAGKKVIEVMSGVLLTGGVAIGRGLLELSLSILIAFFIFRNGGQVGEQLITIVERLGGDRGKHLLGIAAATVRGVVYGILGTALVQAVMAGFGFMIAGVPGAAMLALLTFFLSVVPAGPPLIWIPATLWLFHTDQTGWAIFMLIWGVLISSVDNIVKPLIISQGSAMPFLLILFGVLGGAIAFGFIGVFLGPTLLAVGYRVVSEWVAGPKAVAAAETPTPATVTPAEL